MVGDCLTTNSALLRNDLQQSGLLCLPCLQQGRPSATITDGSVSKLITADSQLLASLDWLTQSQSQSQSYFTTDNSRSVSSSWCQANHNQRSFQMNTCGHSPYVIFSLMRRRGCLIWIYLVFRQVYVSHLRHVTENLSSCTIYKSVQILHSSSYLSYVSHAITAA
jgi:hypothetical protein